MFIRFASRLRRLITVFTFPLWGSVCLEAQESGQIDGSVFMEEINSPLHGAHVQVIELGRSTLSGADGSYEFKNVPPGRYQVIAHLDSVFTDETQAVDVVAGETTTANFTLGLRAQRYEITVTGGGKEEVPFEAFSNVHSLHAYELGGLHNVSIGEVLDQQVGTGISKRSFGPGSSRPIIRGFDGDRVLIMEDGIRTGTLASQSGDHGEVVNPAQLERLEIVRGPATLLYSGNAIGGTVNAISRHHEVHRHPHEELRGYISGSAGTANALAGGSTGFEYGSGNWMIWGSTAGIRTGDYTASKQGKIFNSKANNFNGGGGFGWFGNRTFFSFDVKVDDGSNGVPFAQELHGHHGEEEEGNHDEEEGEDHDEEEEDEDHGEEEGHDDEEELERVSLDSRRQSYRINWGLNDLGSTIENFDLKLSYVDWEHDEVEFFENGEQEIGTAFNNNQFIYRGVFEQAGKGPLSGRFGFWGIDREYDATGEEALSPPVDQNGFALFALEELEFERVKFQFGGRAEMQRYNPAFAERGEAGHEDEHEEEGEEHGEEEEVSDAVKRTFTGGSAAAGLHASLWPGGAFVANYTLSYRAPTLEELYNFGPHTGNLAFEIGNPNLDAERSNGFDLSLRHKQGPVRGDINFFYYGFSNFIFPFATGEEEDELLVIEFTQLEARFVGAEANANFVLHRDLWLNLGIDFVDAQETDTHTPLPRIPPLRGRIGLAYRFAGFQFTPELILASQQNQTFTGETRTPGYAVVNLKASYIYAQQHLAHQFSVNVFNAGDRLYRNHSSFVKDLAPEIGRGVRFTYMVRFF